MADQPQTTLSEVITSKTEEKKTEPSPEQNIQAASEPKKDQQHKQEIEQLKQQFKQEIEQLKQQIAKQNRIN